MNHRVKPYLLKCRLFKPGSSQFAASLILMVVLLPLLTACSGHMSVPVGANTSQQTLDQNSPSVGQDALSAFVYQAYSFVATTSGPASVMVASPDFGPRVTVYNGVVHSIDPGSPPPILATSSRQQGEYAGTAAFTAVAGQSYTALVTTVAPGETGSYTITFSENLGDLRKIDRTFNLPNQDTSD